MREAIRRAEPLLFDFARNQSARASIPDSASPQSALPPQVAHGAEEQSGRTPSPVRLEPGVIGSPPLISLVGGDPDGLRPYQRADLDTAWAQLETVRATIACMATGLGKTKWASAFIRQWLAAGRGRVLWLVTGDELCEQAQEELRATLGEWVSLERAEHRASNTRVVVGSVPTLKGRRLEGWPAGTFSLVVIDEAHHAPSKSYLAIVKHFAAAKILGLSATPKRHDKKAQRLVFDAYVKPPRPISWGVANGYLVPFVPVAKYIDSVDLSHVGATGGDLNLDELEAEVLKSVAAIARETFETVADRRTLIYTPGVGSAHAVAAALNVLRPGCARAVDGTTPRDIRKELLRSHQRGDFQFMVNCLVLKEGYNDRRLRAIVIARPTKSKPLYIQMAGRGGRTVIVEMAQLTDRLSAIAASEKPNCMLIDITGHAGRHNLISAVDLDGRYDDATKARAKELLAKNAGQHLDKALVEAARQIKDEEEKRKKQLATAAAEAKVRARTGTWDPFETFNIGRPDGDESKWMAADASPSDREWLKKNGLPETVSHGEAMKLKRTAAAWRVKGLASFKQRKVLKKHKLPGNVYFHKASELIGAIERNGWHTPPAHEVTAILASGRQVGADG